MDFLIRVIRIVNLMMVLLKHPRTRAILEVMRNHLAVTTVVEMVEMAEMGAAIE